MVIKEKVQYCIGIYISAVLIKCYEHLSTICTYIIYISVKPSICVSVNMRFDELLDAFCYSLRTQFCYSSYLEIESFLCLTCIHRRSWNVYIVYCILSRIVNEDA